jgi:hypothetical protein
MIPQIQRDYAQGRNDKNNDNKIKSYDFIVKIIDVLNTNTALNLDFIYGYTRKNGENKLAFIPLDGQQRLTTLWLLHWYLSPKKETEQNGIKMTSVSDDVKLWLKDFTYETRNSSKRFCKKLIEESLPVSDDVYDKIKDASWFMASWQNDPTVVSMLNMLKVIQELDFDKEKAWENLTKNKKITFDYIDIKSDEFKLTDELYIKMNSRGKPLTLFENFKAQFSEILSAKDTDYISEKRDYEESQISFQEYFAFRIDSVWTDLFWHFEMEKKKDISSCFMNFFIYIAQMCYFKDNLNKNADDFKNDFSVFKKKDNALFLFKTLDFFYKISTDESNQVNIDNINTFFGNLFQKGEIDSSFQGQVGLYEDKEINLFEKCLEDNQFDNKDKIILYYILAYIIKYDLKEVTIELRYYIRVIRNLLQAIRQRKDREIVFTSNIRINSFGKYLKLFNQLLEKPNAYERLLENIDNKGTDISDDALKNEKEKARIVIDNMSLNQEKTQALFQLEEYKYFGGLIYNLNPQVNVENLIKWSKYVREIWGCADYLIAASLITCDFDGFYLGSCGLGKILFWGKSPNWDTILNGQNDRELSKSIITLLNNYEKEKDLNSSLKPQDILEKIVNEYYESLIIKKWQYYFCKYKEYFLSDSNYFSWGKNEFEQEILHSTGYNPLSAYHINPYVKTVSNLLDDTICQESDCYARFSEESCLLLKNGFWIYSKQNGWNIKIPDDQTISDELRKKYNINEQNVFLESNGKNRIEIAVEFCNDLIRDQSIIK